MSGRQDLKTTPKELTKALTDYAAAMANGPPGDTKKTLIAALNDAEPKPLAYEAMRALSLADGMTERVYAALRKTVLTDVLPDEKKQGTASIAKTNRAA